MPAIVTSTQVDAVLRSSLQGYKLGERNDQNGRTGVDLLAEGSGETVYIETIAFKSSPSARSRDFFEAFFRAISRVNSGAKVVAIAIPNQWGRGLPDRARQYGRSWERIGNAFPELETWLVDVEKNSFSRRKWNDWWKSSEMPTPAETR